MVNLIEQATALGVKDNVIWLDRFVPSEDLMTMFKCTSVYLTTFDESTPTSVGVQSPLVYLVLLASNYHGARSFGEAHCFLNQC